MSIGAIQPGDIINERFQVKEKLGEGGFAVVFEGMDLNLERRVAIKILHGAITESQESEKASRIIERFEREAKLAASVDHPCVVKIYDAGEVRGIGEPFMVMEFLEGDSLHDYLLEQGPIEPRELLPLFVAMLTGLGLAHQKGIVHKDLKPDNIFYRHPGSLHASMCIVDFGIAHIERPDSRRVTRDGEFFGTPSYMSPEYITDQHVSPSLDVYQMGLILIECLTGKPVIFHEDPVAALLLHLKRDFKVPRPLVDSPLGDIIDKATALAPEDRYTDALAFAEALNQVDPRDLPTSNAFLGEDREVVSELAMLPTMAGQTPTDALLASKITIAGANPDLEQQEPSAQHSSDKIAAAHSAEMAAYSGEYEAFKTGEAPAGKNRTAMAFIGVLVILLVLLSGVIGGLMISKQEQTEGAANHTQNNTSAIAKNTTLPETTPPNNTVAALDTTPKETAPTATAPVEKEPEPRKIKILTEPGGATVEDEQGNELGETPLEIRIEPEQVRKLQLSKKGFESIDLTLDQESEERIEHTLTRVKIAKKPVKKPAKKPEKKPEKKTTQLLLPD